MGVEFGSNLDRLVWAIISFPDASQSMKLVRRKRSENPMWPTPRNICSWLFVLLTSCTSGLAAETLSGFSPEAWQKAVDPQSGTWSREPLLRQFAGSNDIRAMSRVEIIRSLGEPGITRKIYGPGEGFLQRIDFYRLSAKNDDAFRIDYDVKDQVTGDFIEASSCTCELCELARADANSVGMDALEDSILKDDPDGRQSVTMSELERRVGIRGKHHTAEARIGGQMWVTYSALWRVADKPRGFLIVSGAVPRREEKEFDQVPVENFALVEAWPECLPR
jgi:hypothetical protein